MSTEADVLSRYHTIVVVGLNADPSRPSHYVSDYMRQQGYKVIGVNPSEHEVFGVPCYQDLASVPEPVEFVDVFRRAEFCAAIAREAAAVGAKTLWLQSGIRSNEARRIAEEAGMTYVEDRCVMVEHRRSGLGNIK
jgi:predicted CoA-binding protein